MQLTWRAARKFKRKSDKSYAEECKRILFNCYYQYYMLLVCRSGRHQGIVYRVGLSCRLFAHRPILQQLEQHGMGTIINCNTMSCLKCLTIFIGEIFIWPISTFVWYSFHPLFPVLFIICSLISKARSREGGGVCASVFSVCDVTTLLTALLCHPPSCQQVVLKYISTVTKGALSVCQNK